MPTRLLSDNRIAAHATDVSRFRFDAPASGDSSVRVRLLYRRAFHDLAEVKGWDLDDVPMHHRQLTVSR